MVRCFPDGVDDREGRLTRDGGGGGTTPTNTPQGEEMEGREHDALWSTNTLLQDLAGALV